MSNIHALLHGHALCGRDGPPSVWPAGHSWVSVDQRNLVTCEGCRKVLDAHDVTTDGLGRVVLRPKGAPTKKALP